MESKALAMSRNIPNVNLFSTNFLGILSKIGTTARTCHAWVEPKLLVSHLLTLAYFILDPV